MTTKEKAMATYGVYAKARDAKNVTDYAVAKQTGIRKSMFTEWKAGKYQPKIENLAKVAKAVGIPVSRFTKVII